MKSDEIPFKSYQNIPDALLKSAGTHPDLPFLKMRRGGKFIAYTYQDLFSSVRKIGHYLKENGFVPGERAAVIGENCPEWIFSYLGILWAGGVAVPLDSRGTSTEWAHLLRHAECQFLFVSPRFYGDMADRKGTIPTLREVVSFGVEDPEPHLPFILRTFEGLPGPEVRRREETATVLYTSGTTGMSKGVMLTHGNLLANMEQCMTVIQIDEKDRFFSVLPMHHAFESTAGLLVPLAAGASITIARSLKSKDLLEDLRETKPTAFLVVPLLLEKFYQGMKRNLNKAPPVRKGLFYGLKILASTLDPITKGRASQRLLRSVRAAMGLDALRYLVPGGAALPRWLSKEYEDLGFPILQGYGVSEAAPVISVNLPSMRRNESVGFPLPGIEVKIDRPNSDGVGEIVVKGPNIMKGYYKNEDATQEAFRDGWFFTGDLGKIDPQGFLYITGRKKSLIVTKGGKNISPEEIEERLLDCPFIKETLVLAKIHPRTKNEEIHAIIHPDLDALDNHGMERGVTIDEKTIRDLIEQHVEKVNRVLAEYKRIRSFSIREEEFPKTTTQKIKRYLFEEGGIEISPSNK